MTAINHPHRHAAAEEARLAGVWSVLKRAGADWYEHKAMKLSAALALYTILALAPLLVICIKVLSLVFGAKAASGQIQSQMNLLIGSAGAKAIGDMVAYASKPGSGILATIISFIILAFSASAVFGELQDSLNTIWDVRLKQSVPWWYVITDRLFSMAMVFAVAFVLLVSLFITAAVTTLTGRIIGNAGFAAMAGDIVGSLIVVTLLMAMLLKYIPDVKIGWRDVLLGAFLTAVLFKLGQYLLGLYFRFGSSTSAYGAAGSFVAILLWVYYSAWIFFFGAEFTQAWAHLHHRTIDPDDKAERIHPENP